MTFFESIDSIDDQQTVQQTHIQQTDSEPTERVPSAIHIQQKQTIQQEQIYTKQTIEQTAKQTMKPFEPTATDPKGVQQYRQKHRFLPLRTSLSITDPPSYPPRTNIPIRIILAEHRKYRI